MIELATLAANDTNVTSDREAITNEIEQLKEELTRIADTTEFNDTQLLNGSFTDKKVQVGAKEGQTIVISILSMRASAINNVGGISVTSNSSAGQAMTTIQDAIRSVSVQRSKLGAIQNRLEHTVANLDNISENTSAAESRLRDTDMAEMMVEYSKNNILTQAGQSMLAQANQSTQGVLSLLQ